MIAFEIVSAAAARWAPAPTPISSYMIAFETLSAAAAPAVISSKPVENPHARKKRSLVIDKGQTSISLEEVFWLCLDNIAKSQNMTFRRLIIEISASYNGPNLASGIRTFIVQYYLAVVANEGNPVSAREILQTW